jgi:hypothetical protein
MIGLGLALVIGVVVYFVSSFDGSNDEPVNLNAAQSSVLADAKDLAELIKEDGPTPLASIGNSGESIVLSHVGDDYKQGWYAFSAQPEGAAKDCHIEWKKKRQLFESSCDTNITFPVDGEGLQQYKVAMNKDGKVEIDLNSLKTKSGG